MPRSYQHRKDEVMDKKVVMKKQGGFYNCYDEGGIVLSKITGYKFSDTYHNVGFPVYGVVKVCNKLESKKISYEVWNGDNLVSKYKGIDKCFDEILNK